MAKPDGEGGRPAVVVTGGSEGIGLALARRFAKAGHATLIVARDPDKLRRAQDQIASPGRGEVHILSADLAAPDAAELVAAALAERGLRAHILVNNAGMGLGGPVAEQSAADMARLCDLNMRALTLLTRRFLPDMIERRRGGVINLASLGGWLPGPYQAAYYASKAYVISFSKALAHETRWTGVRVCVVSPGPVATAFHAKMGAAGAHYLRFPGTLSPERVASAAYWGYRLRRGVVVPGLLPSIGAVSAWILPHFALTPFIGWLLKKRY